MESLDVFTQDQLEETLRRADAIPICSGDGRFEVGGEHFVRAADAAHVTLRDSAAVDAGAQATVVAYGKADVTARDLVTLHLHDSARGRAYGRVSVRALDESRVTGGGQTVVTAAGVATVTAQAFALVTATDRCAVRALSNARVDAGGHAQVWAWGNAVVRAHEHVAVRAWGSTSVDAGDAVTVEALEAANVTARGTASVAAFGATIVRAGGRAEVEATPGVTVVRHGAGGVVAGAGGAESTTRPATPAEWCAYYGVDVTEGVATLFKAVEEDFRSYHGGSYEPGSEPAASDWDGGERECGGGLHLSPRPLFGLLHPDDAARFVACPVRLDDMVVHPDGRYRDKVKARAVCAPVYEVGPDAKPLG
jgi:hypothetical protein